MVEKSWKRHERETARYFNTKRRSRGADFSQSDVEVVVDVNEWLSSSDFSKTTIVVECKHRKDLGITDLFNKKTRTIKDRVPLLRIGSFILCRLEDFREFFLELIVGDLDIVSLSNKYSVIYDKKKEPRYLQECLEQAEEYCSSLDGTGNCLPLLSLAKPSTPGRIACVNIGCVKVFREIYKTKND